MSILILLLLQTTLPLYEITVDPAQLDLLYDEIEAKIEVPATITYGYITGDCTLAFRGGTSLYLEKKSWHIRLLDQELIPTGGHLLLNAQFRDASLMRNTLGLFITRELNLPAPETEFVTLSINGEFQGVYERVERVDRLFFARNGLSHGPIFKNVDTMGRLAPHFTDTTSLSGFEPKIDSDPYKFELLQLIDRCIQSDVSTLVDEEIIAAFAVHAAICDNDGIIKNFYIHKVSGRWHYYPWDRDATFGNTWEGIYQPNWITKNHTGDIGYFGGSHALLSAQSNINTFNYYLEEIAELMDDELPEMVDSIQELIESDLALDPYYQYSIAQFDSLCNVLSSDIEERADYLEETTYHCPTFTRTGMSIPSSLDMQRNFTVTISYEEEYTPNGVASLIAIDNQNESWIYMQPSPNNSDWYYELSLPDTTYSVHFAFAPYSDENDILFWFPEWSMRGYKTRPLPTPSARVALANTIPDQLVISKPVWCGENLWVLPITNQSNEEQDLSLCSFSLGEDPLGYIFFAESVLVSPSETFFLTNFEEGANFVYPASNVYGDAGTPFPSETTMELYNPAWEPIYSWELSSGDSLSVPQPFIIPSEIYSGEEGDWVELFNYSSSQINLARYYLREKNNNISILPLNATIPPFGMVLLAEKPENFFSLDCPVFALELGLSSSSDSLAFYSRTNDLLFYLGWDNDWPLESSELMYLENPAYPYAQRQNWIGKSLPGTPGQFNPGWNLSGDVLEIKLISSNPNDGSFTFHYRTPSTSTEVLLVDLAGRVISRLNLPEGYENEINADFSNELSNGVYFLYLRTSSGSASTRFTVLN